MVNSISATTLSSGILGSDLNQQVKISTGSDEKETAKAATTTAVSQTAQGTTATSADGDTLTISANTVKAVKTFTGQSANRPSENLSTDPGFTDSRAAALSNAAAGAGIDSNTAVKQANQADSAAVSSGSSTSGSSSSTETSLSQYSEQQLQEMLQNGEITQAEYNEEIASRQEEEEASDTTDTQAVAQDDATISG